MFFRCSSLTDVKPLENWNVSNGNDFSNMFSECSSLSDIKVYKIGMYQKEIILVLCSMKVHQYQI